MRNFVEILQKNNAVLTWCKRFRNFIIFYNFPLDIHAFQDYIGNSQKSLTINW